MLIVSLSTIPSRFGLLGPTLESIIKQNIHIDAIEVYIPKTYKRFPDYDGSLPQVPEGVTVVVIDEDLGPATKVLPAAKKHRGEDVEILYCDDDRICPPNWAKAFLEARKQRPDDAITAAGWEVSQLGIKYTSTMQPRVVPLRSRWDLPYRVRRINQKINEIKLGRKLPKPRRSRNFKRGGYIDIMEGYGGVLVKPSMFDDACYDIPNNLWSVDDIWLSGCMARQGIGIWANQIGEVPEEQFDIADALYESTINGMNRIEANLACAKYLQDEFGIWQ